MANFEIDGIAYQSRLMNGDAQTLVLKRLLPAFTSLISASDNLNAIKQVSDDEQSIETPRERISKALMPVARELAKLSDPDIEFIINACMEVTSRKLSTGPGWAPVMQRGMVQDKDDAKFATRLKIAWNVLGENFGEMLSSFGVDTATLAQGMPKQVG